MARSFLQHWCKEAHPLTIYAEDFKPDIKGLKVRRLPDWLSDFKEKYKDVPSANGKLGERYSYTHDAVKFSHKVGAITDFGEGLDSGIMIWLDADIYTHADVDPKWLAKLIHERSYIAWLDRFNVHPECGFLMFRCDKPCHQPFMESFRNLYTSGTIFKMRETHDSFVLQKLVNTKVHDQNIPVPCSLSREAFRSTHPLVNGPLSKCFDHTKGEARKKLGRTPKEQRYLLRDGNPYWS